MRLYQLKLRRRDINFQWGPVHTKPEKFENETITSHFGFVFEENSDKEIKSPDYLDVIVFKMFSFRTKTQSRRFQISPA